MITTAALLASCLAIPLADGNPPTIPPASAFEAFGVGAIQDLVVLGETRPIILRLRVGIGNRPFRAAWDEATRSLHTRLDRDHDGKLTTAEAESSGLPLFVAANPGARGRGEVDSSPKDGLISVEELAEALGGSLGSFRLQAEGQADRRTDALYEHIDRDKDGFLTRPELASIVGTLRKLDRDDNELIAAVEVESALEAAPTAASAMMGGRASRDSGVPSVIALTAGESPLRLIRSLLKKYDIGSSRGPGKPDSRLSPEEFAIPAPDFAAADSNGDGTLNNEELRKYLARGPVDLILDVNLTAEASGQAAVRARGVGGGLPSGFAIRQLAENLVEVELGLVRLVIRIDDGTGGIDSTRRALHALFEAADASQDGYLDEAETMPENGQPSLLASLFKPLDRDGDGKLYLADLDAYVDDQATSGRARLALTASNEGRALFGMLDLNSDRQLGAREVLDTFARVTACDRDRDGRVSPEEVPHQIHLTLSRGDLSAILAPPAGTPAAAVVVRSTVVPPPSKPTAGPDWFRRMDRNHDGDVSRREFLGTHPQFDRLDLDHDGLLGPGEAEAARPATTASVKGPGG